MGTPFFAKAGILGQWELASGCKRLHCCSSRMLLSPPLWVSWKSGVSMMFAAGLIADKHPCVGEVLLNLSINNLSYKQLHQPCWCTKKACTPTSLCIQHTKAQRLKVMIHLFCLSLFLYLRLFFALMLPQKRMAEDTCPTATNTSIGMAPCAFGKPSRTGQHCQDHLQPRSAPPGRRTTHPMCAPQEVGHANTQTQDLHQNLQLPWSTKSLLNRCLMGCAWRVASLKKWGKVVAPSGPPPEALIKKGGLFMECSRRGGSS